VGWIKGYITNSNLLPDDIIKHYSNLWKIEKAFRISKTDLKVRPIYHRLRNRIEAHICISFVSYVLYKELERVLAKHYQDMSIIKAIDQINKMYEVMVQINEMQKVNIPLRNNQPQQKILDALNRELQS
jgi:transposase